MAGPYVDVCLTPGELSAFDPGKDRNVVVVDILRATTAICTAFGYGVESVIPVADPEEALRRKQQGMTVAGEQDGIRLPFADFGNSPVEFRTQALLGRQIVYCTTNGTRTILHAAAYGNVTIASFVNLEAVAGYLGRHGKDTLIVCSGWKGRYSLEDAMFAGALADLLMNAWQFISDCDAAYASTILWRKSARNLIATASKSSHYLRLLGIETRKSLKYCFLPDKFMVVPAFRDGELVDIYTESRTGGAY
jgi:2-phosphosulfolactate phosphatase